MLRCCIVCPLISPPHRSSPTFPSFLLFPTFPFYLLLMSPPSLPKPSLVVTGRTHVSSFTPHSAGETQESFSATSRRREYNYYNTYGPATGDSDNRTNDTPVPYTSAFSSYLSRSTFPSCTAKRAWRESSEKLL